MYIPKGVHIVETTTGDKHLFLYILELEDGLLLFDTGEKHHPQEAILPFMAANGLSTERIRLIVNSHADVDHFGGNHAMRAAAPGAIFACHNLDRRWIASRERTMAEHYNRYARDHGVFYDEDTQDWLREAMGPDVPIALGLGLIIAGYRRFRYGEEVESIQDTAKKAPLAGAYRPKGLFSAGFDLIEEFSDMDLEKLR